MVKSDNRLFVRGDADAFCGLFVDNLANLLVLTTTLVGVIKMPMGIVYGRILPAFGISVLLPSIFYYLQAKKLAKKEGRSDVTALPFGMPTTALFLFLFSIILPVYIISGDPIIAYRVGIAACLINGIIEIIGSFCGEWIRKVTPRAALLGTLAGIAIAFIALKPTLQVFSRPEIGFVPFAIILLGFVAKVKMPGNLPAGLIAVVVGTAIAWIGGYMDPNAIRESVATIGFYPPTFAVGDMIKGFADVGPYIAVIIPLALHSFLSTMQNVESASAVGDKYEMFPTMIVDGASTVLGALLGSMMPTTVYIGHPGYKAIGARAGYTLFNGIAVAIVGLLGLVRFLQALIPLEAVYVILIYVGIIIMAQAFASTEKKHYPAVAFALVPHLANYGLGLVNNAVSAMGGRASNPEVIAALARSSVDYRGLTTLAGGAAMSAMLLASLIAFIIDHDYKKACITSAVLATLSYFGIIHSPRLSLGGSMGAMIGYLIIFALLLGYHIYSVLKKPNAAIETPEN